jgi:crossover junction endodeoxyribonuclease RusA
VNDYYGRNGHNVYLKQKGRDYIERVRLEVSQQLSGGLSDPISVNMSIILEVTFPVMKRKRDLDNLLKATLDSLVKTGVILDDSLIKVLIIRESKKRQRELSVPIGGEKDGGLKITINPMVMKH